MHDHEFLLREDGWSKAKTEITKKKKLIYFINIENISFFYFYYVMVNRLRLYQVTEWEC